MTVAVVTGGASGIGAATCEALAAAGTTAIALDLTATDGGLVCDVTDQATVDAAIAAVVAQHGGLDIVVNAAGIGAVGDVTENDDDTWHRLYDVNVVGIARTARAAMPHLVESRCAAIVNVASIAATAGLPLRACYSATKGAVLSLTLAMAADGVATGVRVNAVAPGTADTPWVQRLLAAAPDPAAARTQLEQRQPMGRLASAHEVAAAIAYLASPAASFTTGTILAVDGGMQGLRLPPTQTRV